MGLYYTTYLHYGKFEEKNLQNYTILSNLDPIIEFKEKEQNFVDKNDIKHFLAKHNISFDFKENEELYITESSFCTYDFKSYHISLKVV